VRLASHPAVTDGGSGFDNFDRLDNPDPEEEVEAWLDTIKQAHLNYRPVSFWKAQDVYIEMLVEKIDLKSLFSPICARYSIPIASAGGWCDINTRAAMMRRFEDWEMQGKRCVFVVLRRPRPCWAAHLGYHRGKTVGASPYTGKPAWAGASISIAASSAI
jgi:hypothetical protein